MFNLKNLLKGMEIACKLTVIQENEVVILKRIFEFSDEDIREKK